MKFMRVPLMGKSSALLARYARSLRSPRFSLVSYADQRELVDSWKLARVSQSPTNKEQRKTESLPVVKTMRSLGHLETCSSTTTTLVEPRCRTHLQCRGVDGMSVGEGVMKMGGVEFNC